MPRSKAKGKGTSYAFTKEDIVRERDEKQQSWAQVATALGFVKDGKPQTTPARHAYRVLTGKAPSESRVNGARAPSPARTKAAPAKPSAGTERAVRQAPAAPAPPPVDSNPHWNVDSDQDEIIERLTPRFEENPRTGERSYSYKPMLTIRRKAESRYGVTTEFFEELVVQGLIGFHFNKDETRLCVELYEFGNGNYRCFNVDDIAEVM